MAFDQIHSVGSTQQFIEVTMRDATTGVLKTGLVAGGVSASYVREGGGSAVSLPLAPGTLGAWTSGGWTEVDAINLPGVYQLGLPNSLLAAGAKAATLVLRTPGAIDKLVRILLISADLRDASGLGLSRLDVAVSSVSGGSGGRGARMRTMVFTQPNSPLAGVALNGTTPVKLFAAREPNNAGWQFANNVGQATFVLECRTGEIPNSAMVKAAGRRIADGEVAEGGSSLGDVYAILATTGTATIYPQQLSRAV